MSLRQVLTIYNAERQLSDDETALLNTLRRMNEGEIHFLVESLSGKSQKKAGKKSAGGGGKSKHASSLESTIKSRGSGQCVAELASTGKPCGMARPHVIHSDHNQDVDAHDFLSAVQLNKSLESQHKATADDGDSSSDDIRCQFIRADGKPCKLLPDHNIHHLQTANEYHPFVSTAPDADGESPPQSKSAASAVNSATDSVGASGAAGG